MTNQLLKSSPPMRRPTTGMIRSFTSESTILPKAAPMITPTARSTTLPLSSVTVRPVTPISDSASRTSSSLNGLMIASTFFMRLSMAQMGAPVSNYITLRGDTLPLGPRRSDRVPPILAEAARRDADADGRLPALVLVDLDQPHHLRDMFGGQPAGDDLGRAQVFLDVRFENRIEHIVGRQAVLVGLLEPQLRRGRSRDDALGNHATE